MATKIISAFHAALLIALSFIGMILLYGEEQDTNLAIWTLHLVVDKAIAAASFYGVYKLYILWKDTDPLIKAYDKWSDADEDEDFAS